MPRTIDSRNTKAAAALLGAMLAAAIAGAVAAEEFGHETCLHGKLEHAVQRGADLSKAFDDSSGRDLRNFPPDRLVDFTHMKLEMDFEDIDERRFTASESLSFIPLGSGTASLALDGVGLKLLNVSMSGQRVEYFQDDTTLSLLFDPPLLPGTEYEVVIGYECDRPYDGMFFTPSSPDAPDYGPEVHTHGQTESNRHWFFAHDFPNERLSTELIVTAPSEYSVAANGRLVSNMVNGNRAIWHWLQEEPHVSYLVSLVIGKFDIVELQHERVPMKVWAPPGLGDRVLPTYGRTGRMIDVFELRFGVPYPWDRYDQLIVKNFVAGGMENTSATTMYPTAILNATALLDGDLDGLIAHELAHQWTGDLITCKSWAHIWLNEGWATYGSALWFEERDGRDGYLDSMRGNFRRVARRDKTSNPLPMVSPIYERPGETFGRAANPYPKGASILHMLRMMLGEEVFWSGVQLYMTRHALDVVETNDFRYAMEEASGLGLEWFFEQWCYRPGIPRLAVDVGYDPPTRELHVDVRQEQQIDERTPAFRFTLPIAVHTSVGDRTYMIDVTETETAFRAVLDAVPSIVAVDPDLHVLKTVEVSKPLSLWTAQAVNGPSIASRHAALEALADYDTPDAVGLLRQIAGDETTRHTLRETATRTLAKLGSTEARAALLGLAEDGVADARVRAALIEAIADLEGDDVTRLLAQIAGSDASYATRVAAIKALGEREAAAHADLIAELVHFPSQHDQVRRAALDALAALDDARGLDLAIEYSAYGLSDRARSQAVRVIGKLAEHDTDRAVERLLVLLHDPEWRTVSAAASALADTGDERGLAPLEAMASSNPDPALRRRAERLVERLQKKMAGEEVEDEPEGRGRRG